MRNVFQIEDQHKFRGKKEQCEICKLRYQYGIFYWSQKSGNITGRLPKCKLMQIFEETKLNSWKLLMVYFNFWVIVISCIFISWIKQIVLNCHRQFFVFYSVINAAIMSNDWLTICTIYVFSFKSHLFMFYYFLYICFLLCKYSWLKLAYFLVQL